MSMQIQDNMVASRYS